MEAGQPSGSLHVASLGFLSTWSLRVALFTWRLASPRMSVPQTKAKAAGVFLASDAPECSMSYIFSCTLFY